MTAYPYPVRVTFDDGYNVQEGTFNLNAVLLEKIQVTQNPVKTSYREGDTISYSGLVVTAVYSDGSTENITNDCSIIPEEGKPFNPDTDTEIQITYSEQGYDGITTENVNIQLTEIDLVGISVTSNPTKTGYKQGEPINYTGLVVTASYSDGSTKNVTDSCSITPANGKAFNPLTDSSPEITYLTETATLMFSEVYLTGLSVTSYPNKTAYKHDERISYNGMAVTASYSDSSTLDVTDQCSITPAKNKKFDAYTDTAVEISYSEGEYEVNCSFNLTAILPTSLQVTTNPSKTSYSSGEAIDYSGIAVTVTYSNNSTENVTAECSFAPASGKLFDPQSDTNVTITFTEGQNVLTCSLILTAASENEMRLIVATMPTKSSYKQGDTIDYSGAVIKAVHPGGTEHTVTDFCDFSPANGSTMGNEDTTVTVKCAPPAEPYVFDQKSGYVANGVWKYENPTNTYIDIYTVTAGHKYLLTLGSSVGSRFRAMFTTTDVSQASADVSGTQIINTNNPAAYSSAEYTPPSNGYIVVAKDNVGVSGLKTYLYDTNATAAEKTVTTNFTLTAAVLESIAVTKPVKARYRVGENFDYTGAIVTANYSGGLIENVTEEATFNPINGTLATSNDPTTDIVTPVTVSYGGKQASFDVTTGGVAIVSLSVTPPNKTVYHVGEPDGETIDYTGCTVTAVYWDGTTKDVTTSAVFTPANGSTINRYFDVDENNNVVVSIVYQEIDERLCSNIRIDYSEFSYDNDVERSNLHFDKFGDAICYAGSYAHYYPVKYLDISTGQTIEKRFKFGPLIPAYGDHHHAISSTPSGNVRSFSATELGEIRQEYGQWGYILERFSDFFTNDEDRISKLLLGEVPQSEWGHIYLGRRYHNETFVPLITAYYDSHASYTLNLNAIILQEGLSITPPTKTSYNSGETIDYTGATVTATYSDGTTEDVTSSAVFSPSAGTAITQDTNVSVSYTNQWSETASGSFSLTVVTNS